MYTETVTTVRHWNGRPLLRAYSVCSAHHEDHLEFFSIKVQNGPLTQHLQKIQPGDQLLVGAKPTGTLIQQNLKPGKTLYLLGTGTGLAPFISIIKDPETYDLYDHIVLAHGCREIAELGYGEQVVNTLLNDEFFGEVAREKLLYYPTVTREPFRNNGRLTALFEAGKLEADLGLPKLNKETDRVMLCGSPHMLSDLQTMLESRGFGEGSHHGAGEYVIEKAFVEK